MDLLNKAVSNVIASLTFGCRFEYNDPRIIKLLDLTEDGLKEEFNLVRKVRKELHRGGLGPPTTPPPSRRRKGFPGKVPARKRLGSGEMADNLDRKGWAGVSALPGGSTSLQGTGHHEMYILGLSFWAQGQERGRSELREDKVDDGDTGGSWDLTGERLGTRRSQVPRAPWR